MATVTLDVSSIVIRCKDGLSSEWTDHKKSGLLIKEQVCRYSIGGPRDSPVAVLKSVAKCVDQWQLLLRDVVDCKKPEGSPLLEMEIVVGADCSASVYPQRHVKGEASHTNAYSITTTPAPTTGRRKKAAPKTPEEQFLLMVEQVANYILDHLKKLYRPAVPIGNMNAQYLILGSAAVVKNRLNYYKDLLRLPTSKTHTDAITRVIEITDVVSQTVLNYHCDLLRSALMHDADSHDWEHDKIYRDGENISTAIHMWIFYIQGVRNDLYSHCSAPVSLSLLTSVLSDTLNILVTRYTKVRPSQARLPLYRADVLALLALVAGILPSLVTCPEQLLGGGGLHSPVLGLHRRAQLLLVVAAVKAAPVEQLQAHRKLFQRPHLSPDISLVMPPPPAWLAFLQPVLFPPGVGQLSSLPPPVAAYHIFMCVACGAAPDWPLLVRGLVAGALTGGRALLRGLRDYWSGVRPPQPCGGAMCYPHLCSPPLTPQTVYGAVVQILFSCVGGKQLLRNLMFPDSIKPASWDSLDKSQVWNSQRPPWHHVMVQLAVPCVLPVVEQLVRSLPPQAPAQPTHPSQLSVRLEHHLTAWLVQLLQGVQEYVSRLPVSLVQLCQDVQAGLPPTTRPSGGHVMTQVLLGALYSVITSRPCLEQLTGQVTDGQWDMCVAMGERVCGLESCGQPVQAQAQSMTQAALASADSDDEGDCVVEDPLLPYPEQEACEAECEALTAGVLSTAQGQHALGAVREFLQHNMEWVTHQLQVPPLLPHHPDRTAAPPQLVFSPSPLLHNPLYYQARILYARLDHEGVLSHSMDWSLALSTAGSWLPPSTALTLFSSRPELQEDAVLSEAENRAVDALRPMLDVLNEE